MIKSIPAKRFTSDDVKLTSGEQNYTQSTRFRNAHDLWTRFNDTHSQDRENKKQREKIVELYNRAPYKITRAGKVYHEPNWGRFTDSLNDYIRFFSSIVLDREIWCRIETYVGLEDGMSEQWSDDITEAFHKCCIKKWHKKDQEMISCIRDDCFFNLGVMYWEDPYCVYPCHKPREDVYPDTNATTDVDSFDLLFIKDQLTSVELYDHAISKEDKEIGWNKEGILAALRNNVDGLADMSNNTVMEKFRRGDITQAQQDQLISIVYCYVKEYKKAPKGHERAGNRISLFVIPETLKAVGVTKGSEQMKGEDSEIAYLRKVPYIYEDFCQAASISTSNIKRGFYNSASFAAQIYLACRFIDQTSNSIIRAIKRNMRLWVKTGSSDTKKRVSSADPNSEVEYLDEGDSIEQISLKQDVNAAMEVMRTVSASINQFSPSEFQGTQNSPKGYPITKGEANILSNQLDDSKSTSIKLMISKDREFCKELTRRFLTSTDQSDNYDGYELFVRIMEMKGIPKEAYDPKNIEVFSRFNQFAGKASANYAAAKGILEATQIKPASPAEENARRDVIASLSGEANVSRFIDQPIKFDHELFVIGQENEALDNPTVNPENVAVGPADNHMLHVQGHSKDYMMKLQVGNQLLNRAVQDKTFMRPFFLQAAADMINSQDNKGAHIEAHLVVLQKDVTKQDEIKELMDVFKQAQSQQDQLAAKVQQLQQQDIQSGAQNNMMDMEFEHAKRMKDLEYESAVAQNNIKAEKSASQTQASQQATATKHSMDIQKKATDNQLKVQDKTIELQSKAQLKALDIEAKQQSNALAKQKTQDAKAKKTTKES
jgi:hypothetical protein